MIDAVGAQAIVARGMTATNITIDGVVFGGSSDPVIDLFAGDDVVTINGTVRATSASPVISLGAGDDTLNNNSSQTIEGPGVLVDAGPGNDTVNQNNGMENNTSRFTNVETTNVGRNMNPNDPANGMMTTVNVDSALNGGTVNANEGGSVNVSNGKTSGRGTVNANSGGQVSVTADNAQGTGSGQNETRINTMSGSQVNITGESRAGTQNQRVEGSNFGNGTTVRPSSGFQRGTAAGDSITLNSDFSLGGASGNDASVGAALNNLVESGIATAAQQNALDALIGSTIDGGQRAVTAVASSEAAVQSVGAGLVAAGSFHSALRPSPTAIGARIDSAFGLQADTATIAAAPQVYGADIIISDPVVVAPEPIDMSGIWVSGFGSYLDVDATALSNGYQADIYGGAIGLQRSVRLGLLGEGIGGVAVGYSFADVDGFVGGGEVDTYSVGAYFSAVSGQFSSDLAASYSYQDIDTSVGDTDAHTFIGSAEGFYDVLADTQYFAGPLGRIGFVYSNVDGFTAPGALGARFSDTDVSQFTAAIGGRIGADFDTPAGALALSVDALYEFVSGDDTVSFAGQFGAGNVGQFTTATPFADEDRLVVGVEAGFAITDNATLSLRYEGTFGDDVRQDTGNAKLTIRF